MKFTKAVTAVTLLTFAALAHCAEPTVTGKPDVGGKTTEKPAAPAQEDQPKTPMGKICKANDLTKIQSDEFKCDELLQEPVAECYLHGNDATVTEVNKKCFKELTSNAINMSMNVVFLVDADKSKLIPTLVTAESAKNLTEEHYKTILEAVMKQESPDVAFKILFPLRKISEDVLQECVKALQKAKDPKKKDAIGILKYYIAKHSEMGNGKPPAEDLLKKLTSAASLKFNDDRFGIVMAVTSAVFFTLLW